MKKEEAFMVLLLALAFGEHFGVYVFLFLPPWIIYFLFVIPIDAF